MPETTLIAMVGDYVHPDGWSCGQRLKAGYEEAGCDWRCDFRLPCGGTGRDGKPRYLWGINVTVTGRVMQRDGSYRCRIEFVGDGAPSEFAGGRWWPESKTNGGRHA